MNRAQFVGPYTGNKQVGLFISIMEGNPEVTSILVDGRINRITVVYEDFTTKSVPYELVEDWYELYEL